MIEKFCTCKENMIKQVIVIRKDLNMRKGKMCAQAAHASMKGIFDVLSYSNLTGLGKKTHKAAYFFVTNEMVEWIDGKFTKIVVGCDSEEELHLLYQEAKAVGLPCAIIEDSGATEFKQVCPECEGDGIMNYEYNSFMYKCKTCKGIGKISKPTYTAIAIGPAESEDIDKITGHLKLL